MIKKINTLFAVLLLYPVLVMSQGETLKFDEIISNSESYVNNIISVDGIVDRHLESNTTAGFYLLRDDFGKFLRVRTIGELPSVNERINVYGLFTREIPNSISANFLQRYYLDVRNEAQQQTNRSFLVQMTSNPSGSEVTINGQVIGETPLQTKLNNGSHNVEITSSMFEPLRDVIVVNNADVSRDYELNRSSSYYTIITLVGLGLVALMLFFLQTNKTESMSSSMTEAPPKKPLRSESSEIAQKKKNENTPSRTVKVLSQHFTVEDGLADVKKIQLYQNPEKKDSEYTIGREANGNHYHIQIDSGAVSRKQAKLIVMRDMTILVNYASKDANPTTVNDRELMQNESCNLHDGDRVQMGDVVLTYHV